MYILELFSNADVRHIYMQGLLLAIGVFLVAALVKFVRYMKTG